MAAPALRLLVDRVRDVRPGFELTAQNAPALAELCRRLGGLPLALELAAASMRLLTPQQMLTQLYVRLEHPGALVDLPDRQQTSAARSCGATTGCPPSARELLNPAVGVRRPVHRRRCRDGLRRRATDVVEDLSMLLDSSMVNPAERPDGQRAFQLLAPIRRFAAARLERADDTLSRLHGYVLDVTGSAGDRRGAGSADRRLDSEQRNLQAVIEWVGRDGRASGPLLRALGDAWVWMLACGHLRQTSPLWQQIRSLPPDGLRTRSDRLALRWLTAHTLLNDGAFAEAGALVDAMLPDARAAEPPARVALLLRTRAVALPYADRDRASATFEEALAMARDAGDPLVLGYVSSQHGLLLCAAGAAAAARERHAETLGIAESLNDENLRAEAHYALALNAMLQDDPGPAWAHLAVAVDRYRGSTTSTG